MKERIPGCRGFTLWRGKLLRVELWICRAGVQSHRHPGQRVEVVPLWGKATFWRVKDKPGVGEHVDIGPRTWGRMLTIPAGWWHGFHLWRGPLVFVNFTFNGKSAAENFVT